MIMLAINPGDIGGAEREVPIHPCYNPHEVTHQFWHHNPYDVRLQFCRCNPYEVRIKFHSYNPYDVRHQFCQHGIDEKFLQGQPISS